MIQLMFQHVRQGGHAMGVRDFEVSDIYGISKILVYKMLRKTDKWGVLRLSGLGAFLFFMD